MLDNTSVKILKLLKSKGSLPLKTMEKYIGSRHAIMDNLKLLEENKYIFNLRGDAPYVLDDDGTIGQLVVVEDIYKLMPLGEAYIESISRDRFRYWVPIVISAIALVISVIALIPNMPLVYEVITQWLKK